MSKNVPLLGAMMIVGKDSLGRRIILPTNPEAVKEKTYHLEKKKENKVKRFMNAIKRIVSRVKINSIDHKIKMVKLKKRDYDDFCKNYNDKVSERIFAAQELWKRNKRSKLGFKF